MEPTPFEQLFDDLGAEVAIVLRPYTPMPLNRLRVKRLQVEEELLDMGVSEPWLPEWAKRHGQDQRSVLTCVWDKPVPFKAGHRKWLMRSLLGAGVYEDQVSHVWAVPESLDTTPLPSQFLKYREMTLRAIEATDTRYVMLIGLGPLHIWRPALKMKDIQGYSGVMERRWVVYPMTNPITVLREPMLQGQWRQDLYNLSDMIRGNLEFNLMKKCAGKCDDNAMMYDPDGIGWCQKHWKKGIRLAETRGSKMRTTSRRMNEDQLWET